MANENLLEQQDDTVFPQPEPEAELSPVKTNGTGVWRLVLLGVALIVIFILLYPFGNFTNRINSPVLEV